MAGANLSDKANGTRLSRLLIDKGTEALRRKFNGLYPPVTLAAALNRNKKRLLKKKYRVINDLQWGVLYPASGNPDSNNFDITLLLVLFSNICNMPAPATGWNAMPPATDTSFVANIVRMRLYRNDIYAHVTETGVNDEQFEILWHKISKVLVDLGIRQQDIDELKTCSLSPEEEIFVVQLKEWELNDEKCLEILNEIKLTLLKVAKLDQNSPSKRSESEELLLKLAKYAFKGDIENVVKSFHEGTRAWLFKRLDDWFADQVSRVMILTASPGFGKSVFAGKVCQLYKKKSKLAACHFCKFNDSNLRDPRRMLESLASHMCDNVEGFKENLLEQLKRPHKIDSLQDAFRIYLNEPLHNLDRNETMLTVVDGLDESDADGKSELLELIANEFPKLPVWIKLVVTSRPEIPVKQKLNKFHPIEITPESMDNEDDIRLYFESCLPRLASKTAAILLLVAKCQGSFLVAPFLLSEMRHLLDTHIQRHVEVTIEEIENILPKGIESVYERYFYRLEKELSSLSEHIDFRRILEVLVAARGPLPLTFLHGLCGLPEGSKTMMEVLRKVNDRLSSLLDVFEDVVTVFHKSVVDWLAGKGYEEHRYTVNEHVGGEFLWEACKKEYEEIKNTYPNVYLSKAAKYALDHGLHHLIFDNVNISVGTDYNYLIDPCLVHVINTIYPVDNNIFFYLQCVLKRRFSTEAQHIKRKLLWHCLTSKYMDCDDLSVVRRLPLGYLQNIINDSPCGIFSEIEKNEAKLLLTNSVWCEKMNASNDGCADHFLSGMFLKFPISCVGISPNQKYVAVGRNDGNISLLEFPNLLEVCTYATNFRSVVRCCTFSPDNSFVLYGDLDNRFDTKTQDRSPFFSNSRHSFSGCSFSQSGDRLATADGSEIIRLWDITNQSLLWRFSAGGPVNSCFHSERGTFLIGTTSDVPGFSSCTYVRTVVAIWDTFTRMRFDQRRHLLWQEQDDDRYCSTETSSNISRTEIVLSTSIWKFPDYLQAEVYVLPQCVPVRRLYGWRFSVIKGKQPSRIFACVNDSWRVIDYGGDELALRLLTSFDYHIHLMPRMFPIHSHAFNETFLIHRGEQLLTFKIPSKQQKAEPISVLTCSFSPDGSRLASCTNDKILSVWDVRTCRIVQTFPLFSKSIHCWWSQGYFWLFHTVNNIPTISRFSVNQQLKIESSEREDYAVHDKFDRSFIFAEGVLVLGCEGLEVFALSVADEKFKPVMKLVTKYQTKCAAVSRGGSCILLFGDKGYAIWRTEGNRHESFTINLKDPYVVKYVHGDQESSSRLNRFCAITSDVKHGIFVSLHRNFMHKFDILCHVIDLHSGDIIRYSSIPYGIVPLPHPVIICACRSVVVVASPMESDIKIIDIESGKLVGYMDNCLHSALFVEHHIVLHRQQNILAIPNKYGTIDFIKLHGVQ